MVLILIVLLMAVPVDGSAGAVRRSLTGLIQSPFALAFDGVPFCGKQAMGWPRCDETATPRTRSG